MRIISIAIILFAFSSTVNAQDVDYPWTVGLGYNAVDYQTEEAHAFNIHYTALRISAGRFLWSNFTAEVSYSINKIKTFGGESNLKLNHSALDLSLRYSFGKLLNKVTKGPFEPYIAGGAGRTWLQRSSKRGIEQSNTLIAFAGINYWINPRWAVFAQGAYKNSTDIFADTYHEIVIGARYNFKFKTRNRLLR